MVIPIPGTTGALLFNRKDITIFLKWFKKLCKGHRIITDKGILEQIPNYYILKISNYMENMAAFKGNNQKEFYKIIKQRFRDKDIDQIIHMLEYLIKFINKNKITLETVANYVYQYTAI